jgi:hypothetical protein
MMDTAKNILQLVVDQENEYNVFSPYRFILRRLKLDEDDMAVALHELTNKGYIEVDEYPGTGHYCATGRGMRAVKVL